MSYGTWLRLLWLMLLLPTSLFTQQSPSGPVIPTTGEFDPMREPRFATVAQADFLKDSDRVMGVSANGVSKAYRTDIIAYHHIIHDQLGKMPILATW
jgi:hypothetical protein